MEKSKQSPEQEKKESPEVTKHVIWDCESSLYDSFELKALKKQLDSAIVSRTLSMPHLSDRRLPPQAPPANKKPTSKISRSFQRLIKAVFRPKLNTKNNGAGFGRGYGFEHSKEGFYVVYGKSSELSTIPEVSEFDGLSPEIRSLVGRSASERFSGVASFGISCS